MMEFGGEATVVMNVIGKFVMELFEFLMYENTWIFDVESLETISS